MKAADKKKLTTVFRVLDRMCDEVSESMPLRQALSLISVALHEANGDQPEVGDVGKDTGANSAVASRDLLGLGKRGRTGKPGLGLIESFEDYRDLRRKPYRMTAAGRKVIDKILEVVS